MLYLPEKLLQWLLCPAHWSCTRHSWPTPLKRTLPVVKCVWGYLVLAFGMIVKCKWISRAFSPKPASFTGDHRRVRRIRRAVPMVCSLQQREWAPFSLPIEAKREIMTIRQASTTAERRPPPLPRPSGSKRQALPPLLFGEQRHHLQFYLFVTHSTYLPMEATELQTRQAVHCAPPWNAAARRQCERLRCTTACCTAAA